MFLYVGRWGVIFSQRNGEIWLKPGFSLAIQPSRNESKNAQGKGARRMGRRSAVWQLPAPPRSLFIRGKRNNNYKIERERVWNKQHGNNRATAACPRRKVPCRDSIRSIGERGR